MRFDARGLAAAVRGCAVLLSLLASPPLSAELIERVLAVVDDTPVLQSDVDTLRRVRELAADVALEAMIDEFLMQREASRLPEAAVSPEEEARAVASLPLDKDAADAPPASALRALARRQAAILKYVELRFRPQIRVGDDELQRAYEEERKERGGTESLDALAPELRKRLQARALDERIESWVRELRAAARVRRVP